MSLRSEVVEPVVAGDMAYGHTGEQGENGDTMAVPARPERTRRSRWLWIVAYWLFTAAVCLVAALRLWWSNPDGSWQSQFWFIDDINRLLNGDVGHVTWFVFGDQWAMNGYRWFEYANALFFGYDARLETLAYFAIVGLIAALVGWRALSRMSAEQGIGARLAIFIIPLILASLSGAGSRGMELGTFAGILLGVATFLLIDSRLGNRTSYIVTSILVPVGIFVFTGGYASGPAFAVVVVWLLQFWRPTIEPARRRRLTVLMVNFVVWTLVYLVLLRALSPSTGTGEVANFFSTLGTDPVFPAQYLFWGPASGLFTSQTVGMLGANGLVLTGIVSALVILLTAIAVVRAFRVAWNQATVPLLLVLYPWGIALTLLATRNSDPLSLLSTWYSLHFKVALVGMIWLTVLGLRGRATTAAATAEAGRTGSRSRAAVPVRVVTYTLLAAMVATVVVANVEQYTREPFERTFFLNVAKAELFPSELKEDASGLTALELPLGESRHAAAILRKHDLGVYRNPSSTLAKLYGVAPQFVELGDTFDDGWVGRTFSVTVIDPTCTSVVVSLSNPLPLSPAVTYTATSGSGDPVTGTVGTTSADLTLPVSGNADRIVFRFSRTVVPKKLGLGADKRALSANVSVACAP